MVNQSARALFDTPPGTVDTTRRFVRRHRLTERGYVEFAFGIGSPDLMVDLVLPEAAYESFCQINQVVELTDAEALAVDMEQAKWRYGTPGATK